MPILYSVISRGNTVLAKYASCAGNFAEVTEQIIAKIPARNEKLTYSHGNYLFHYISEDGIIYMCITDDVIKCRNLNSVANYKVTTCRSLSVPELFCFLMKSKDDFKLPTGLQQIMLCRLRWMRNFRVYWLMKWNIILNRMTLIRFLECMGSLMNLKTLWWKI